MCHEDFVKRFEELQVFRALDTFSSRESVHCLDRLPFTSQELPYLYVDGGESERRVSVLFALAPDVEASERSAVAELTPPSVVTFSEFQWDSLAAGSAVARLRTSTVGVQTLTVPAGKHVYRCNVTSARGYHLSVAASDQQSLSLEDLDKVAAKGAGPFVTDIETIVKPQEAHAWNIVAKSVVSVHEPVLLSAQLLFDESLASSLRLQVINNDTLQAEPVVQLRSVPRCFVPNEAGYSVVVECKSGQKLSGGKLKVRLLSDKASKAAAPHRAAAFELATEQIKATQDFAGAYAANKFDVIYRKTVQAADKGTFGVQLAAEGGCWVRLEVFDNGVKLAEAEGRSCCTLSVVPIQPVVDKKAKPGLIVQASIVHGAWRPELPTDTLPWKSRFLSVVALVIKPDTEREEKHAGLRQTWEQGQAGRAAKAKKARDQYVQTAPKVDPIKLDVSGVVSAVLPKEQLSEKEAARKVTVELFEQQKRELDVKRKADKEASLDNRMQVQTQLQLSRQEFCLLQEEEQKHRDAYNIKAFPNLVLEEKKPEEKELAKSSKGKRTVEK
eukprot:TRINITY_DN3769_c0_g1_i3.p1 TRINITY_DN3769_c0_g1~~TRINITY_DN3769_c0_g1_i3.p1  ORF type:complete len:556 (-),score=177.56 TRINITY_DN3769_c0_g1_i3:53-1720(-)